MKFDCPECGQRLLCGDEMTGRIVKCPKCASRVTVPGFGGQQENDFEESAAGSQPEVRQKQQRQRRSISSYKRSQKWSDSTNVSMLFSGLIGLGLMVGYYIMMLPFRRLYFGQLFLERGWVPYALVLLMGWSVGFLILKTRKLKSQKNALLLDLLPEDISEEIDVETVQDFIDHVKAMPSRLMESFMVYRIKRGLEHFAVRRSNPEVANIMMSQSEIDAAAVNSSYSVVKVFIWAIPILGFIGTVLGISDAVGGFSGALDSAQDIEVLKKSLNNVTSGLSVAFDTTLVALVMSLIISFPVSMIQKREEDFLGKVDEYCTENLLKRLNDAGGVADVADNTKVMMQVLGNAMAQNQGDMLTGLQETQDRMAELNAEQIKYYEAVNSSMAEQTETHRQNVEVNLSQMMGQIQTAVTDMTQKVNELVSSQVQTSVQNAEACQEKVAGLVESLSGPVDKTSAEYVNTLAESIDHLNKVLTELGEKQVVIQQVKKKGWFFSRKG